MRSPDQSRVPSPSRSEVFFIVFVEPVNHTVSVSTDLYVCVGVEEMDIRGKRKRERCRIVETSQFFERGFQFRWKRLTLS